MKLNNYYNILNIKDTATDNDIHEAYKLKISQFNNLPFHTKKMINEIKLLKECIYVLENKEKRDKYDRKLKDAKEYDKTDEPIDNTKICDRLFSIKFE